MLEKDIENLLAKYPSEFFPKHKLRLKGQQVKIGNYYADIIFKNEAGDMVIVEVKRGILRREAISQILDYYGIIRQKEPDKDIILILVANIIPRERTVFLSEKLGIQFIEIPVSKL